MKLAELSQKPQLIKITIDKSELVEKYGDELEFFVYDRQPLDVFGKLANAQEGDISHMLGMLKDLILDDNGDQVMTDERILPMDCLVEAVKLIGERLGK